MSLRKYLGVNDLRDSELLRVGSRSGVGTLGGLMGDQGPLKGGFIAGGGQLLGDALLGVPKEHTFGAEAARGGLGGSIVGGLTEAGRITKELSNTKYHMLTRYLMQAGLSRPKAALAAIGSVGAVGAGLHGLTGAVAGGLLNTDWDK